MPLVLSDCPHLCACDMLAFKEGYIALTAWSMARGWELFKRKPKLHAQEEIGWLVRIIACMSLEYDYVVYVWLSRWRWFCLESARMWMQDQIDRGADMVMSPMCCLVGNLPRTKHGHHSCSLMSCNIRLGHMGGWGLYRPCRELTNILLVPEHACRAIFGVT